MNSRERASLDRHITGNYGEDQFRHDDAEDDETLPLFADAPACICHPTRGVHSTCCPEYIPARFPKPEPRSTSSAKETETTPARSESDPTPPRHIRKQVTAEAIRRVAVAANSDWKEAMLSIVHSLAKTRGKFSADDAFAEFNLLKVKPTTQDPRAMGWVMLQAVRNGWIVRTGEFVETNRVSCHNAPIRIWRSLLF